MHAFSTDFQDELLQLLKWRRDVRHFRTDPVDPHLLQKCIQGFETAPSVGLSEPWRLVHVKSDTARAAAVRNFETENAKALAGYDGEQAKLYSGLKLSGMREAPEHLAIFCDESTLKGSQLGTKSMPEMRRYSVVTAIMSFWLMARAHGLGAGWVSVLDPIQLNKDLDIDPDWALVAYLCVGWPKENTLTPELEAVGWEAREVELASLIER